MTCSPAFSADENIDMLNRLGKEINVYSKKIVNVDVGDTVNWKSVNPGHNVEFIKGGIPEGVEKFNHRESIKLKWVDLFDFNIRKNTSFLLKALFCKVRNLNRFCCHDPEGEPLSD